MLSCTAKSCVLHMKVSGFRQQAVVLGCSAESSVSDPLAERAVEGEGVWV